MPKIILTDEEKIKLLEAVNAGVEPTPDLLPKLFPGTAEKFDVRVLDRAKIPTLEYAGKRSKAAILGEAGAGIGAAPLQIARSFGEVKEGEWQNLLVQGDNLQFLKTCYRNEDPLIKDKIKGKIKLIYIDPPFGTGDEYGAKDGEMSYSAKQEGVEFIEANRERLVLLKELLSEDGTIFVRLDYHFGHYIKVILDEIFGKQFFVNEIVINRGKQRLGGTKKYSTATDSLYYYSKNKNYLFNSFKRERYAGEASGTNLLMKGDRNPRERTFLDPEGNSVVLIPPPNSHWKFVQKKIDILYEKNVVYLAKSQKGLNSGICKKVGNDLIPVDYVPSFKFDDDKTIDSNWTDISGYSQDTGYPTENSEPLLERVIHTGSDVDDLVIDIFGGSGTTAAVAEKLGRRWVTCDFGKHSIYTIQKRMFRIAESKALTEVKNDMDKVIVKKGDFYQSQPKPFSVVSAGAYDFSHVMALGNPEHKDAYIAFVLGLFQLGRDEEKAKKFKLTNIFADKDGSPVEVYPVWDERYLKEVRIDEEYLQEIINQAGGRLSGEYHIITPEHCTNVGDTTLKNSEGKYVTFKFLTFPYKVLEDASRHFELHEQPASQSAVNKLITSTAFYFNEDVEIELVRYGKELKITKFDTKILDKDGNRFPELEGIAMLLVDIDHEEGKPFDMDKTIFAKDIKEDGVFPVEGISDKTIAVIAIDKHGNESEPFVVK